MHKCCGTLWALALVLALVMVPGINLGVGIIIE